MNEVKQYADRDIMQLDRDGNHYCNHVLAMTREGLHDKSHIAAELAFRDRELAALREELAVTDKEMEGLQSALEDADKLSARMIDLLSEVLNEVPHGLGESFTDSELAERIRQAIKPTESGASE